MNWTNYESLSEKVYRRTLPNGLQVVVVPRPGFSKKLAYFVTDFGAIDLSFTLNGEEMTLPQGTAHYLEHKLFDMPNLDVSAAFAALGASVNAFTSYDMTAYYFLCTQRFEECLALLVNFVSTPYFTQESVAKEQGIIEQEIGMNADNPDTRIFESLMQAMYENHPIRNPILGSVESIAKITPQVLETAHKAFYRPENMLLCVVGDVDPEQVCQIAEENLPATEPVTVTRKNEFLEEMSCQEALKVHDSVQRVILVRNIITEVDEHKERQISAVVRHGAIERERKRAAADRAAHGEFRKRGCAAAHGRGCFLLPCEGIRSRRKIAVLLALEEIQHCLAVGQCRKIARVKHCLNHIVTSLWRFFIMISHGGRKNQIVISRMT